MLLGSEIVVLSLDEAQHLVRLYESRRVADWFEIDSEAAHVLSDLKSAVRRAQEQGEPHA